MSKLKKVNALCYLKSKYPAVKIGLRDYDQTVTALSPDGKEIIIYQVFRADADGYEGWRVMTKSLIDDIFGPK